MAAENFLLIQHVLRNGGFEDIDPSLTPIQKGGRDGKDITQGSGVYQAEMTVGPKFG